MTSGDVRYFRKMGKHVILMIRNNVFSFCTFLTERYSTEVIGKNGKRLMPYISWAGEWGLCRLRNHEHFDNPQAACEAYRQSTKKLKSYMQRQWSLVGGMAGTFKEME